MTIIARTRVIGLLVVLALLPIAISIYWLSDRAEAFLVDMQDQRTVVDAARHLERSIVNAETGQRAYLISGAGEYLAEFRANHDEAKAAIASLRQLSEQYPAQSRRIQAVLRPAVASLALLERLDRSGRNDGLEVVRSQLGRFATQELRQAVNDLALTQDEKLETGSRDIATLLNWARALAIGGSLLAGIVMLLSLQMLTRHVRNSLATLLSSMQRVGTDGVPETTTAQLTGMFHELGTAYNAMCARMKLEIARRDEAESQIAVLLDRSDGELADRQRTTQILSQMSNRLPACVDQAELVTLAQRFIPQLFNVGGGALYFLNNSGTVLQQVATWGDATHSDSEFAPVKCWGLRRGQQHHVQDVTTDITCAHVHGGDLLGYICMPLIAQGDTVGMLYLENRRSQTGDTVIQRELEDMRLLCESLALALVNLRLRESLHHQSLRDPLTGLHNRRYLQESIELEFAKSNRSGSPISIIMLDVDHFKRINDSYGHETGDIVLRRVAGALQANTLKGDIVCRYGGEEFLILLPDVAHRDALDRAETLRKAISALQIQSEGYEIAQVTASFGVSTCHGGDMNVDDVIRSADGALYAAKAAGRDRVRSATGEVVNATQQLALQHGHAEDRP